MGPEAATNSVTSRLPRVDNGAVAHSRLAAARRGPLCFSLGSQQITVEPVWEPALPQPLWSAQVCAGGVTAWVEFDRLDPLLPDADALLADADELAQQTVVQQLVELVAAALEPMLSARVVVTAGAAPTEETVQMQLRVQANSDADSEPRACVPPARVALRCAPGALGAVAQWWQHHGQVVAPLPVTVTVSVRIASCTLTSAELRALAAGDLLLPDRLGLEGGRWQVHLVAGADRRCFARGHLQGEFVMISQREAAVEPQSTAAAAIDQLTVDVAFEIGARRLPLGELMRIGPGYIFDLGAQPDGEVVDLVVNGQSIGRGHLVLLGEALGVRVTRVMAAAEGSGRPTAEDTAHAAA